MSTNAVNSSAQSAAFSTAAKPSLDAAVASELDALWRSVFERVHAGETHDQPNAKPNSSNTPMHGGRDGRELAQDRAGVPNSAVNLPLAQRPQFSVSQVSPASNAATVSGPSASPEVSIDDAPAIAASELQAPKGGVLTAQALPEEVELPAAKRVQPADNAAQATPPEVHADEIVRVFMNGGAVTINVRDAALTEDEALRCAFETARTLTGERAALRTLMLNGRTVYRQAPRTEEPASPTLFFAC